MGSSKVTTTDLAEPVVEVINTVDTVADQIAELATGTAGIKTVVDANKALLENGTYGLNKIKAGIDANATTLSTIDTNVSATKTAAERLTSTRAGYIDVIGNSTNGLAAIKTAVAGNATTLSTIVGHTGNIATINTNCSNLNSRLTSTRAGYLDYLANSTYGLSAIKTAINNVNTAISSAGGGYMMSEFVEFLSGGTSKSYTYPVFITGYNSRYISIGGKALFNGSTDSNAYGPYCYLIAPGCQITSISANETGGCAVYKAVTA